MFEGAILKMIVTDPAFWLAVGQTIALAGCAHYLMKCYHLCVIGWRRMGRYIVGILIIAAGFAGWWATRPEASGPEIVSVIALLTISAGATTLAAYGADNTVDREQRGEDLKDHNARVED